ncbi:MAG TPA: NnrS family protein [Candidatus Acidoferrales bacterium]|nr:NnrS family protein [Candidatus Acidoferrales bacterium]
MRSSAPPPDPLPEAWRRAFDRDRTEPVRHADPGPERRAGRMLAAFIATGLVFLALPGTLLGVWNLVDIARSRSPSAPAVAWIQAHGQAQLFGWVGTFILGISLYVLPKFRNRSLKSFGRPWAVWVLWTTGVSWRWIGVVYGSGWRAALVGSGLLELAAYAAALWVLFVPGRQGPPERSAESGLPQDLGSWLGIFGFFGLGVALVTNLVLSLRAALTVGSPVYPPAADRVFLLLSLWAFVAPVAWGYSTRFVTIFLGLEPPVRRAAPWLGAGAVAVVSGAFARRFVAVDLVALAMTVGAIWALRVFRAPIRPAKLAGVYRHYPAFVRLAYVWLVVAALLGLAADLAPSLPGLGGAGRHAMTVGFIATLIFCIGPRILPSFLNGRELASPGLMAASLWLLALGCALRVSAESVAYASVAGPAWTWLPVSAFIELAAVLLFALNLGLTLAGPMPAWFVESSLRADLPLYFYVTSFPKTRPLLVRAGLKTLARAREVPLSLTLAEAARADGVDADALLGELRRFFKARQPRRLDRPPLEDG